MSFFSKLSFLPSILLFFLSYFLEFFSILSITLKNFSEYFRSFKISHEIQKRGKFANFRCILKIFLPGWKYFSECLWNFLGVPTHFGAPIRKWKIYLNTNFLPFFSIPFCNIFRNFQVLSPSLLRSQLMSHTIQK